MGSIPNVLLLTNYVTLGKSGRFLNALCSHLQNVPTHKVVVKIK